MIAFAIQFQPRRLRGDHATITIGSDSPCPLAIKGSWSGVLIQTPEEKANYEALLKKLRDDFEKECGTG